MPALAAEGLTAERLARLAQRAAQAEEALEAKAQEALADAEADFGGEQMSLRAEGLAKEPFEIALRMLAHALAKAGSSLESSRLHRLEAATRRLREAFGAGDALRFTIAGALVHLDRSGRLVIRPEPPRRRGR
jgi:tRNA(Ile)-lysidine synthase